jgi:hypothetical protein
MGRAGIVVVTTVRSSRDRDPCRTELAGLKRDKCPRRAGRIHELGFAATVGINQDRSTHGPSREPVLWQILQEEERFEFLDHGDFP